MALTTEGNGLDTDDSGKTWHGFHGQDDLPEDTKSLTFICEGNDAKATGRVVKDPETGKVVLLVCAGSTASLDAAESVPESAARKRDKLLKSGILKERGDCWNSPRTACFLRQAERPALSVVLPSLAGKRGKRTMERHWRNSGKAIRNENSAQMGF